jgi:hypothetical protein
MGPKRIVLSVTLVLALGSLPVLAGPTSHAMEVDENGAVLFVDLDKGRLLRLADGQLTVVSQLEGVPDGDAMQNLIRSISGELYVGLKKTVWVVTPEGELESAKPPPELKVLFANRPGDLAPDGSVYVARDFKNIQRSLPGGDSHPVLVTDVIGKIYSLSVTPYGRVFFANNSEIAKLDAQGEVEILQQVEGERILGLAAMGENAVLVLRQKDGEGSRLERLDVLGNTEVLVSADQIGAVSEGAPVRVADSSR